MKKRSRSFKVIGLEKRKIISENGHIGNVRVIIVGNEDKKHYSFLFQFFSLANGRIMSAIKKQFVEIRHPHYNKFVYVFIDENNETTVEF